MEALLPYHQLKDKDTSRRYGVFVAEGWQVVARLASSPWSIRSVLVQSQKLSRLEALFPILPEETPVYVAPDNTLCDLLGFSMHRGIMALGERDSQPVGPPTLMTSSPVPSCVLALCGVNNHENVGMAFRNAAALGVHQVVMDAQTADPLYRRALRVSAGNTLKVPFSAYPSGQEMVTSLKASGYYIYGTSPSEEGVDIECLAGRHVRLPSRLAVVLGAEDRGLPVEVLQQVDQQVQIRMAGDTDSLNVATAGALVLFALRMAIPEAFNGANS